MEQLRNINSLSKNNIIEKDLKNLYWYVLFTEIGREFSVRNEWIKIKNKVSKDYDKLDKLEIIWTPILEENIDDKVIVTPYLIGYYFVGMSKQMTTIEYTIFKEMCGAITIINFFDKDLVHPIDYDEMISMFNLPIGSKKTGNFSVGNSVKIMSGALQNYSGKIKEIRGVRAFIEAGILKNFSTDIEVSLECLELATV